MKLLSLLFLLSSSIFAFTLNYSYFHKSNPDSLIYSNTIPFKDGNCLYINITQINQPFTLTLNDPSNIIVRSEYIESSNTDYTFLHCFSFEDVDPLGKWSLYINNKNEFSFFVTGDDD